MGSGGSRESREWLAILLPSALDGTGSPGVVQQEKWLTRATLSSPGSECSSSSRER